MARTLLSALARAPQRSLWAACRWYSAQWRQQDSLMGKGLLALMALSVLLCLCLAANAFLAGCSPGPATPAATLTSVPRATSTSAPTLTAAPTRTATAAPTPRPTDTLNPTLVPTVEPTEVPTAAPTVVQATTAPPPPAGGCAYIGNQSSMIFHYPGCNYVARMSERNKVCLPSREAAIQQGYRPCQVCNP